MASVYKRGRDEGKRDAKYVIAYVNEFGKQVTRVGYTDKQRSLQLAVKLERDCQMVRDGITTRAELEKESQSGKPITEHVADFEQSLSLNPQTTPAYIQKICNRIKRSLETFSTLSDLHDTEAIRKALAKLRDDPKCQFAG